MQRGTKLLIAILCAFAIPSALAQTDDLAFSRNARTFETQQGTLITKSMAFACLAMSSVPDGLPCNPAFTPVQKKPKFELEGLISNGYSTLELMRQLLAGNVTQDMVNALFSNGHVLQIEGNAQINFLSQYFNASYTPISAKYFSVVRNEANPTVDLYADNETNVTAQTGYELTDGLYVGLQIRSVWRKYIRQQFQLLDILTDQGKQQLQPETQQAVYFEPGAAYTFDLPWKPTIAVMGANLGPQTGDFTTLPETPEAQYAASVSPALPLGDLHLELDYKSLDYSESEGIEKMHFGALYHLAAMYVSGGVDYNGVSGGMYFTLQEFNAGILYSTTKVSWQSNEFYAQTVYVEAGWQL